MEDSEELLATQIFPGLYLGSPHHASQRPLLNEAAPYLSPGAAAPIRSILNATEEVPSVYEDPHAGIAAAVAAAAAGSDDDEDLDALRFEYLRCRPSSIWGESIEEARQTLAAACAFVDAALKRQRPVLVHGGDGEGGAEHAGALVAAYLVQARGWASLELATVDVRARRPEAEVGDSVMQRLRELLEAPVGETPAIGATLAPPAASEMLDDSLWLGTAEAATAAGLRWLKADCVVNMTHSVPFADVAVEAPGGLRTLRVAPSASFSKQWPEVLDFLRRAKQEGRRTLVHCTTGSRAAVAVIGFLMELTSQSFSDAMKHAKRRRVGLRPNSELSRQLLQIGSEGTSGGKASGGGWGGLTMALDLAVTSGKQGPPLALEDGSARPALDVEALEKAVVELGVLPVPADLRREVLLKHSGNIERAASELLAWLEGDTGAVSLGKSSASSSSAQPGPSKSFGSSSSSAAAPTALAGGASSSSSGGAAAASSSSSALPATGSTSGKRSSSQPPLEQKVMALPCPAATELVARYLGGQDELAAEPGPECVICGSSRARNGSMPEPHPDLGWVHPWCLKEAMR